MVNLRAEVHAQLPDAYKEPKKFERGMKAANKKGANIIERNYKREAPVDKGGLRRDVQTMWYDNGWDAVIGSRARNRGRLYPEDVHEGTYAFKGVDRDYGGNGRIGAGRGLIKPGQTKGSKRRGAFSYIDARSGQKGIRPNKFARRAEEASRGDVVKLFEEAAAEQL